MLYEDAHKLINESIQTVSNQTCISRPMSQCAYVKKITNVWHTITSVYISITRPKIWLF